MYSVYDNVHLCTLSSLIRISADYRIFASPRSFSQLVTSFFGAMYLGILRMLFVAWSFLSKQHISLFLVYLILLKQKFYALNSTNLSYSSKTCKIALPFSRINQLIFKLPFCTLYLFFLFYAVVKLHFTQQKLSFGLAPSGGFKWI